MLVVALVLTRMPTPTGLAAMTVVAVVIIAIATAGTVATVIVAVTIALPAIIISSTVVFPVAVRARTAGPILALAQFTAQTVFPRAQNLIFAAEALILLPEGPLAHDVSGESIIAPGQVALAISLTLIQATAQGSDFALQACVFLA